MSNHSNVFNLSEKILAFNRMYKLPNPAYPTTTAVIEAEYARLKEQGVDTEQLGFVLPIDLLVNRLNGFKNTLLAEIEEVEQIINKLVTNKLASCEKETYSELEFLVDMADWLCDIQVYCASEMRKYGLNNDGVMKIIMASNASKLAEDGSVIYDSNGKVLKGSNYWKPESTIAEMISYEIKTANSKTLPSEGDSK